MPLLAFDRTHTLHPSGAELASSGANRVLPVAPVNPSLATQTSTTASPGVINDISPKLRQGESVYTSVPDPLGGGSAMATSAKDWAALPGTEAKRQDPPPKPLSQVLLEHIRSMWDASAYAVQALQANAPPSSTQTPRLPSVNETGSTSKQLLVYSPGKVKKNEGA